MLILAIILAGMMIGAAAQFILGRDGKPIDWSMALIAGLAGSFVGGLLFSLIAGDGIELRASGLIGSIVGAVIVTAIWQLVDSRKRASANSEAKARARSGKHH